MKQALGGAALLAGVAWLLFVFTTPEPCERIVRAAAPVRISFDTVRWAAKNWLSTESRIDMIRWSLNADAASQRFLTHQFYGEGAQCVVTPSASTSIHAGGATSTESSNESHSSSAALPTPVAAPASGAGA